MFYQLLLNSLNSASRELDRYLRRMSDTILETLTLHLIFIFIDTIFKPVLSPTEIFKIMTTAGDLGFSAELGRTDTMTLLKR